VRDSGERSERERRPLPRKTRVSQQGRGSDRSNNCTRAICLGEREDQAAFAGRWGLNTTCVYDWGKRWESCLGSREKRQDVGLQSGGTLLGGLEHKQGISHSLSKNSRGGVKGWELSSRGGETIALSRGRGAGGKSRYSRSGRTSRADLITDKAGIHALLRPI